MRYKFAYLEGPALFYCGSRVTQHDFASRLRGVGTWVSILALAPSLAHATSSGSIGWQSTGYSQSWYHSALALGSFADQGKSLEFKASAQAGLIFQQPSNPLIGFELPEIYASTAKGSMPFQLHLGRKRSDWSKLDRQWQLGIWEPRYRWDILNPERVGLTGLFLTYEAPGFELEILGSPGVIPERGSPMELRGDQWLSASPFARTPPPRINVLGADTRVSYNLRMPSYSDLLLKPGLSMRARLGRKQGFFSSVGYAYKPMNQALLAYDGLLNLGSGQVQVDLHPRTSYHHAISGDLGYETSEAALTLSSLVDFPVGESLSPELTYQRLAPSQAFALTGELKRQRLVGSVIAQFGGNAPDGGKDADGSSSAFEYRYPYQVAAAVTKRDQLTNALSTSSRVLYDFTHPGVILSAELAFRFERHWLATLGGDLLVSGSPLSGPGSNDLISLYRGNDRIQAGVSYVF